MLKILIAEDEPPIMRMIRSMLEAADDEFCVTGCCMNGKAAVSKLEQEDFDIVFTDIKMPVMSGIELAGWIHENKPGTMVIIISGYSDFEYARKALEYKVFDYLLKPLSKDKVHELTERIKDEFGKRPVPGKRYNDDNSTVVILACAGAYLLYGSEVLLPGERFWTDAGIEGFMNRNLDRSEEYIFFNTNMLSERCLVISADTAERQEELVRSMYGEFSGRGLPVTIMYKKNVLFKDAGKCFGMLREQLIKQLILDRSQLICCDVPSDGYEDISQPYSKEDIERMTAAIKNRDQSGVRSAFTEILERMRSSDGTQEELNGLLNTILDAYTLNYPKLMERKNTSVKREFVNALASFVSYDAFVDDIVSILMSLRSDKRDPDRYEQLADAVEEYLIKNYNKNITSDILSREFGFVPSYISRLFKRQKGVSPNEYVTKYRIETAKKLLSENSDMRIKDIAAMVGFKEAYYFSKTFKRETGMWPTEFINNRLP